MAEAGLVVNARHAMPDASEIRALGVRWVRSIIYDLNDIPAMLGKVPAGVKVCALLNNENAQVRGDWSGWESAIATLAERFQGRIHAVECGNELDLWLERGDTRLTPQFAASLARRATPILRAAGMASILTSVAGSSWQWYLEEMARQLRPGEVDYANLHPYGQRAAGFPVGFGFGEMDWAVRKAHELSGLPVAITEWGIKIGDAGGEANQAEYIARVIALLNGMDIVPFHALFAWSDRIGTAEEQGDQAFGLRRANGSQRPSWFAVQRAIGGQQPVPPPAPIRSPIYQQGFLTAYESAPNLVGLPKENEYGPVQGMSLQRTENGQLIWANVAGVGSTLAFIDYRDGSRYLWREERKRLERI
jgi:hypothetical protein